MLLLLLFALSLDDKDVLVRYEGTEVYQPLMDGETLVSPEGKVYILNFADAYINHYAPSGEKLDKIGRKGKGPGEFTYATQIFFSENKLYVYDLLTTEISVFQPDGAFVKRFGTPARGLIFAKIKGGWIYGDWNQFMMEGEAGLFLADDAFESTKRLLSLKEKGQGQGLWVMSSDGNVKATFSPIDNYPKLRSAPDESRVYLTDPNEFLIFSIDAKGEVDRIERKDKRIPFDTEWADEQLAERKEENRNLPKVETNYPDYFPMIRELIVAPDGTLVVNRWRGRPDDKSYPLAIDDQGREIDMPYSWELLTRLAGVNDGFAYITVFNVETEEAGVVRVPLAQAEAFVEKNPIEFDGDSGRSISISL